MIKYYSKTHSFTYDKASADTYEMPSYGMVKKDKYGNIIFRMLPFYKTKLWLQAEKYNNVVHFNIISSYGRYASESNLKDLFNVLASDKQPPFAGMTYDEVLVKLDLLEAMRGKDNEH